MIRRLYVEKRSSFRETEEAIRKDWESQLGLSGLTGLRRLVRYDVSGVSDELWAEAHHSLFSEPPVENTFEGELPLGAEDTVFAVEYVPGQFDQRADSAEQCLRLLGAEAPQVQCAEVFVLEGQVSDADLTAVKRYCINPVDSREASLDVPLELKGDIPEPAAVRSIEGFLAMDSDAQKLLHKDLGLAMSEEDLAFCQHYFKTEAKREPSLTEIKLLDTYWSDHCRHSTFLTSINSVEFSRSLLSAPIEAAWDRYLKAREDVFSDPDSRPICLMDLALIGMRWLKKEGKLEDLEDSPEVNAASIVVPIERKSGTEEWLVMFKNETHNHPTEIEPFGGAATCLGGAIRDPLSGRSYVYQAMRVTGAADPRTPYAETLPGKLPQRKITVEAAHGYSSYGNQIGLATGLVTEIYDPGYLAKRMEVGAVIAAAPRAQVRREEPMPGDRIVLVGGRTGRDGIGGATGSSKEHTNTALENSAEVQKGDPPTERKLQRLFRHKELSLMIKRCNDFGAGGVSVAIGELAPSLEINLDRVPLKYAGLDGTEIALSESQERMAVVLDSSDVDAFVAVAAEENLEAVEVAEVTDSGRLIMRWRGAVIVDIDRAFLDTNGVRLQTTASITAPDEEKSPLYSLPRGDDLAESWTQVLSGLNVCSQQGLIERFDSTIGAGSVLHPFGGKYRKTPTEVMAARIPCLDEDLPMGTLMSFGFHADVSRWSPFHGSVYAVIESVARILAAGGSWRRVRLTFQEYFERLRDEPERWGKPLAALLGAWEAQAELGLAAIGGKDSMSGSFQDLDVPPTLVSFAVCPVSIDRIISPEFKGAGHPLGVLSIPRDESEMPIWPELRERWDRIEAAIADGSVLSAYTLREGGLAAALSKMAFGNRIGVRLDPELDRANLFARDFGGLVLEFKDEAALSKLGAKRIGQTQEAEEIQMGSQALSLAELLAAWESPLEPIFPTKVGGYGQGSRVLSQRFEPSKARKATVPVAKPRVWIPAFPGTNCEWDSARAFEKVGADASIGVFRNQTRADIEGSIDALVAGIEKSQILMLPGGFSAGDEPSGSGKFIASVFRNPRVAEATMRLIRERDGLILGICNGFQALIKLGLVPFGEIRPQTANSPTLTLNQIGRHVSCYASTQVVSKQSPWLSACTLGEDYLIAMSHGEGRLVGPESVLQGLFSNDLVATQYVDFEGHPTIDLPHNPNGSMHAIEGLTSPCGRVFGKMGHSEREGKRIGINLTGNLQMPIFESGVAYYS